MDELFKMVGKGTLFGLMFVVFGVPLALAQAWPVMLGLGVLHNDVSPHVPALGFWACFLLLWSLPTMLGLLRGRAKVSG